ncbi:hypothetical protein L7F22_036524 [Adiantum nelumboides]|nr:hypothetical protein [Adiantum nelumboides]
MIQMSLDCTRKHRVRFADEVYTILDMETEEEVEAGSSSSMDTDSSWETQSFCSRYQTIDILHVDKARKEDKLEKVQEDVLDTGYVKEPLPTNEDMHVNKGAIQSKGVGQLSSMSMDSSAYAVLLTFPQEGVCALKCLLEANVAVKYGFIEVMYEMGACKSYTLSLKHGKHIGFSRDPSGRYKQYEVAVNFLFDSSEDSKRRRHQMKKMFVEDYTQSFNQYLNRLTHAKRPTDEMLAGYYKNGLQKELQNAVAGVDVEVGLDNLVEIATRAKKRYYKVDYADLKVEASCVIEMYRKAAIFVNMKSVMEEVSALEEVSSSLQLPRVLKIANIFLHKLWFLGAQSTMLVESFDPNHDAFKIVYGGGFLKLTNQEQRLMGLRSDHEVMKSCL